MNKNIITFLAVTLLAGTLGTGDVFGQFGPSASAPRHDPNAGSGYGKPNGFKPTMTVTDPNAGTGPAYHYPRHDPNAGGGYGGRHGGHGDGYGGHGGGYGGHSGGYGGHGGGYGGHGGGYGGAPYYSSQLRAQFVVVPSGGRAITHLHPSSPLRRAGLEVGDIITHLDGIPVHSNWELENHHGPTLVYGIDWRTGNRIQLRIFIH